MAGVLRNLMKKNGKGFVFSLDGGAAPVCRKYITREFHRALTRIGISVEEIKRRGLIMHGWRHFLNTELLRRGLTIQQVQSVTGHNSGRMSEWYNHPDARAIPDVIKAQEAIFGRGNNKPGPEKSGKTVQPKQSNKTRTGTAAPLKLVKKIGTEQRPERKHA
jgi:hypothetical protein